MKFHAVLVYSLQLVTFLTQATANHLCSPQASRAHGHSTGNAAIPVRVFALDFDGTATTLESKDVDQFVYQATLRYQNSDKAEKEAMAKRWDKLIEDKSVRLTNIIKNTLGRLKNSPNRITAGKIFILRQTLAEIGNTLQYILKSKEVQYFLKRITMEGIKEIAISKAQLCPRLIETLKHFRNNPPNIISAGVSKSYDEFVLQKYNAPTNLIIHAGEFEFKNGVPTGKIIGQLTAFDKENIMAQLIKQHQNTNGYSIYVGNDFPDILAMLKADIGIAINYTPLFIRFVHALGIATQSVSDWRGACSNREYLIYTAQSWNEIEEMMFGDLERN